MIKSFDIIGNIIIIEIPKHLQKNKKQIISNILLKHKNIKTIYEKISERKGKYRNYKLKCIFGENNPLTIHKESGVQIKVDVKKCYFSPRLSTERFRIAKLVKQNESILVLFSGVAPYPIIIAKNSNPKEILGIELNPTAHKYAQENVKLNKLEHKITLLKGDVKKILPAIKKKFDRILMPLPKTSESFLKYALKVCKRQGTIHFYCFAKENEFDKAKQKILKICSNNKVNCRILRIVKAGQTSPRQFRICIDFKVIK